MLESLKNTFLIGIVEIINKKEYERTPDRNIVVVTNEDDIILRYLLLIKSSSAYPSGALKT
jgi:hypothetical protein